MLGGRLKYAFGRSTSGRWEKWIPDGWDWSRCGGHYDNGRDFFSVHWEVQLDPPESADSIRLHVESPRDVDDPDLNAIKREFVEALLGFDFRKVVREKGYCYRKGKQTTPAKVQKNKSTTVFHVVPPAHLRGPTHQEDVEAVHAAIGPCVDKVLEPFVARLNTHFSKK